MNNKLLTCLLSYAFLSIQAVNHNDLQMSVARLPLTSSQICKPQKQRECLSLPFTLKHYNTVEENIDLLKKAFARSKGTIVTRAVQAPLYVIAFHLLPKEVISKFR